MSRHAANTETGFDEIAALWVARTDRAPLLPEEVQQLDAWLDADPRHLGAFARASAVLVHFDRAKALGAQFNPARFCTDGDVSPRRSKLRGARIALAASLVLAIAAGLFLAFIPEKFSTGLGEVRLVSLPDGTRVTLNTASAVTVHYGDGERRVRLVRGEALFTVAKDASRPFIVENRGTYVRALGTSFTVRSLAHDAVQVVVSEGVVEVTRNETIKIASPVRLTANTRAYAQPQEPVKVASLSGAEVARELAWREGMISFSGITLREAAQEFARYSDVRILFDDPVVSERTVTGLFASNNPQGFAQAIAISMNLTVEVHPDAVRLKSSL